MTAQQNCMILLNKRILIPQTWIGVIQSTIEFERVEGYSECPHLYGTDRTLMSVEVQGLYCQYAALMELNELLNHGFIELTDHGLQQVIRLWVQ